MTGGTSQARKKAAKNYSGHTRGTKIEKFFVPLVRPRFYFRDQPRGEK